MCRPNECDIVRIKKTLSDIEACPGSSKGLRGKKQRHILAIGSEGMARGPDKTKPGHFLIMFDRDVNKTLVASICHTNMKGVHEQRV